MAKSELIGIRVTKDELLDLWTAALDAETTLSTFVREAALERARQPLSAYVRARALEPAAPWRSDGPPLDTFVSDDQQINTVLAKMPRRSGDA